MRKRSFVVLERIRERELAGTYPGTVFLPGHGPLARADDLRRHAGFSRRAWGRS
jgi:glyoxylase-like metal-dependent hydrolase (beta-lactamase superfamily II)